MESKHLRGASTVAAHFSTLFFRPTRPAGSALGWLCGLLVALALVASGCEDINTEDPPVPNNGPGGQQSDPDAGTQQPQDPCKGEQICRLDAKPDKAGTKVPFKTNDDFLLVRRGGSYRPIFMKGINLGVGVPGTRAGHLAATREQYAKWFDQMTAHGINALRIYTLHYPRFYEELAKHNKENADHPIYLLHGIWLPEEFEGLHLLGDQFEANMREIVDCTHGNCHINHRYGKAYGTYETDVSRWILGWVIGREVNPEEVELTNEYLHDKRSFDGKHIRVTDAQPSEVWWGEQVDYLIDYELSGYGQTRPISVSSWPTLDPLDHPTEGSIYTSEDIESFDMMHLEPVDAPGGLFATFHAYPYYPDFIVDDPDYREHSDAEGKNSYLGYLLAMKQHFDTMPLFIGETGVPSSWGSAHWGYENMNHGGHTEVEQGEVGARLFRTVYDTNCAGAALFAWIDEWWKPTWITDPRGSSAERRPFWHNVTSAEQNFGLIAFDMGEPPWEDKGQTTEAGGFVQSVTLVHDVEYFHVRLQTSGRLGDGDTLEVAFDTYGDKDNAQFDEELGESILPSGIQTNNRNEFALEVDGTSKAELMVTQAYDSMRIWYGDKFAEGQLFHSAQTDGGDWNLVTWMNSQAHGSNDQKYWFEETFHEIGKLTIRRDDQPATSKDAVVVYPDHIDIRIPWTLLNVTDPSKLEVLHTVRNAVRKRSPEHAITRGIAVGVTYNGSLVVETERYHWDPWGQDDDITDIPGYVPDEEPGLDWQKYERAKPALQIFGDALKKLPDWMN